MQKLDGETALEEYRRGDSLSMIAKRWNTNAKQVSRLIRNVGGKIRSFRSAQKLALQKGRIKHPTKGRERTDAEKEAISDSAKANYDALSFEEKQRLTEGCKKRWEELPLEKKVEFWGKAKIALVATAKYGSKAERFLYKGLIEAGYRAEPHQKHVLGNDEMHIDILLNEARIAIEVDGITHHEPVFGTEEFLRRQDADLEKNRAVIAAGYHMVRVKLTGRTDSQVKMRRLLAALLKTVESLKTELPCLSKIDSEELNNGES